jgi:hypothetical protein
MDLEMQGNVIRAAECVVSLGPEAVAVEVEVEVEEAAKEEDEPAEEKEE